MAQPSKLRRQIAGEAARLLCLQEETAFHRAKLLAARRLTGRPVPPDEMPSNTEIRAQLRLLSFGEAGEPPPDRIAELRRAALGMMRLCRAFRPRLVGSALDGRFRAGSHIDIEAFAADPQEVAATLAAGGLAPAIEPIAVKRRTGTLKLSVIRIDQPYRARLLVYPLHLARTMLRRGPTAARRQRANMSELSELLANSNRAELEAPAPAAPPTYENRFQIYEALLAPLAHVTQDRKRHPEGDALYHSLQVFELARAERPYDEEFLLAALLHDVGKGLDPRDHVAAGVEALGEAITERTRWFIEHHLDGRALRAGKLGHRFRRRLEESDDYEELVLLADLDVAGRKQGVEVMEVDEALAYIRDLAEVCGE